MQKRVDKPSAPKPAPPKPGKVEEVTDLQPAVALGKSSDEELMRRTPNGDKASFSILYDRYSSAVLSYLYRMLGNVEDVESIGQEVFLRAFRFAPTYRYPQKFSTWLFTITRNLAINHSRRRKRCGNGGRLLPQALPSHRSTTYAGRSRSCACSCSRRIWARAKRCRRSASSVPSKHWNGCRSRL